MNILIVDDSSVMRKILTKSLLQSGYADANVVQAIDGKSALDELSTTVPDIILSDWNMPGMSGLELLEEIRREGYSIPFGFITTESTVAIRKIALASGANFLIPKPFSVGEMKAALDPILKPDHE